MTSKKQATARCTALLRSGQQCCRYYKVGAPEPFCAMHASTYRPSGAAVGKPRPVTFEERLQRFAEHSDPRVAMQAIAALDRRMSASSPDTSVQERLHRRRWIEALTETECFALQDLLRQLRGLENDVYERCGLTPRLDWRPAVVDAVPSAVVGQPDTCAEEVPPDPSPVEDAPEDDGEWVDV